MPRRLGRPVLVVLLLVASAACISMGARLRLRAKPKSLEAIRHALGEEVGALFALARNPDGAAQHWKYADIVWCYCIKVDLPPPVLNLLYILFSS